ncbi:short transient receptor potential channel 4-like [Glandiceps talaboti]
MSHNMVQAALWEQWSHGQLKWTENPGFRWTGLYALFAFFAFGIVHQLLPINMILCCKPKSKLYQLFNSPRSCFLSHYFHYAFFLAFIYLYEVLVTFKVDGSTITLESNINYIPILILSIIWFATLCLIEFGQIVTQGISCYFRSYWNILDWIILFSFLISVIIANPYIVGQSLGNPYIYIIFSKLTSVTFVCALLRFMAPFYLSNFIGPTLLIFTDMKFDIIRFLIIFAYVIFAYSLAMYYFYVDVGPGSSDFATLSSSLTILVSSIFGGEGFESLEISNGVWMNLSSNHSNWAESTAEYYTAMGYTLYVLFGIITLIMLLNLCIAMLSDRYTKFKDNIDVQWKFERSKIWMDYIGTKGSNCNALSGTIYLIVVLICLPVVGVLLIRECYREGCQDYDLDSEDDNGNSYEEEGGKEIIIMNEQAEDTDEVVLEMQVIGPDSSENTDSEGSEETNENASDQDSSEKSDSEENEETNENKPTLEFNQLMTLLLERYYDKHYVILKKTLDVADKEDE